MKLISLLFITLLCFSLEEIPQTNLILTKELIEKTENTYENVHKINVAFTSEKQTPSKFLAQQTCSNPYLSSPHWVGQGCNKLGQCTEYFCGVHSVKQVLAKFGIDKYDEYTLAKYAGTDTSGTSHEGIEKAFATVAKKEGIKLTVEWHNFSSLGSSVSERFKAIGKKICKDNVDVIIHNLYRNTWGHYETVRTIDVSSEEIEVLNSLGNRDGEGYLGYREWRSFGEYASYISGISQRSIAFIYKK
jgi:hypothetical protein